MAAFSRWPACAGTGQRPETTIKAVIGYQGKCPVCGRWVGVTKRSWVLARHKAQVYDSPGHDDPTKYGGS